MQHQLAGRRLCAGGQCCRCERGPYQLLQYYMGGGHQRRLPRVGGRLLTDRDPLRQDQRPRRLDRSIEAGVPRRPKWGRAYLGSGLLDRGEPVWADDAELWPDEQRLSLPVTTATARVQLAIRDCLRNQAAA